MYIYITLYIYIISTSYILYAHLRLWSCLATSIPSFFSFFFFFLLHPPSSFKWVFAQSAYVTTERNPAYSGVCKLNKYHRGRTSPTPVRRWRATLGAAPYVLNTQSEEKNTVFYSYLACFVNALTLNLHVST